jgi:hypothetical protein
VATIYKEFEVTVPAAFAWVTFSPLADSLQLEIGRFQASFPT